MTIPHAPREMPPELVARYTMDGRARVEDWYLDDTRRAGRRTVFTRRKVAANLRKARRREAYYYGETDLWLYEALQRHPIGGLDVVNMGSTNPWYESVAISHGAQSVTVIEYNPIVSRHRQIRAITPQEFDKAPRQFTAGLSISSFEHDGLGRYGDPLDPDADLAAIRRMKRIIQPGGLLYLAVPVGRDKVVWNAHRIYGEHRFPLLVAGWEMVGSFGGFEPALLRRDTGKNVYQPLFVLRNAGA